MPRRGGAQTAEAIQRAAVASFFRHGYEATTLRELAADVGVKVGSLYNHISSKEQLLFEIMSGVLRDLEEAFERAVAPWTEPADRLRAAVECHIGFHAERAQEVFIGNSELRSLSPAHRAFVVEQRDTYERELRRIVEDGQRAGDFPFPSTRLATYAIVAIGTHVSSWWQPGGALTLEQVASAYSDFILRAVRNPELQVEPGDVLVNRSGPSLEPAA